jgi:hypothetical protein
VLALACRRGNIRGTDVGAIRVDATYSTIEVARAVAEGFEREAGKPDPRDPRVRISRADRPPERPPRPERPSSHARAPRGPQEGGGEPLRHRKR